MPDFSAEQVASISFSDLAQFAMEELDQARRELAEVPAPALFDFQIVGSHHDLGSEGFAALMRDLRAAVPKGSTVIYALRPLDGRDDTIELVHTLFETSKTQKGWRSRDNQRLSPWLYVGSSRNITKRIKEHLGFGSETTYALKLSAWLPLDDFPLELTCAVYPEGLSATVISALEDALWERLKPMFGRKGSR